MESTPTKKVDEAGKIEKTGDTVTNYYKTKIVAASNTAMYWRQKIISKGDNEIPLSILDAAEQLNDLSANYEYKGDFKRTFKRLYDDIIELQRRQDFSRAQWKIVTTPIFIVPVNQISLLISGIFHVPKNLPIFSEWNVNTDINVDFLLSPEPFTDKVDRLSNNANSSLDNMEDIEGPPYTQPRGDWSINSISDVSHNDSEIRQNFFETNFADSHVDTVVVDSYKKLPNGEISSSTRNEIQPKGNSTRIINRRNLSRSEKMGILDGSIVVGRVPNKVEFKRSARKDRRVNYIPYEYFQRFVYRMMGKQNI